MVSPFTTVFLAAAIVAAILGVATAAWVAVAVAFALECLMAAARGA